MSSSIKSTYNLDQFQTSACDYIDQGYNVLVSAPTGAGKTLIAEYAIENIKIIDNKSLVIYTCPIKSLCNEKYKDLSTKYSKLNPDYIVGLMTGDISLNADGDIIVMTTEVLANLTSKNIDEFNPKCIIFDEFHYINDDSRGHVWEKCIIISLIKYSCINVLLSATIGNIDQVMHWLNMINPININKQFKSIIITKRPVPLLEYIIDNSRCRNLDNKSAEIDQENPIYTESVVSNNPSIDNYDLSVLDSKSYLKIKKYWEKLTILNYSVKFELCTLCSQIELNPLLGMPAIIFVLSKIKCINYAEMIETSFVTEIEKISILKFYDDNLIDFKSCSQYIKLRNVISKGIGYHHSGLIPKIREVVEFLIKNKLIKLVFATETFAVGLNFPVKTVVLTSLSKPSENGHRYLHVSEYKQMCGRAGRRYVDIVGNVILWLYDNRSYPSWIEINNIVNGPIDCIQSKFIIEPNYVLKNLTNDNFKEIGRLSFKYYKLKINSKPEIIIPIKFEKLYQIEIKIQEWSAQGISFVDKNYKKNISKLSKDELLEYKKFVEIIFGKKNKNELETYVEFENEIILFLQSDNFITNNITTLKGDLGQLFNEINSIIFVNHMDYILSNSNNIVPVLSMFIDDGKKLHNKSWELIDIMNISKKINITCEPVIYFMELVNNKYKNYFYKYPKWTFNPLNYLIIITWITNINYTLDDMNIMFDIDIGLLVKILIKMYQVTEELIDKLVKINKTDLNEYLNNTKKLLIRHPLKLESLYI